MLGHEVQHAPAPTGASALSELSERDELKNGHLSSHPPPVTHTAQHPQSQPRSLLTLPLLTNRQGCRLSPHPVLCPATAWQGHSTGLQRGKFAWRCCWEQPLSPKPESIIQSPGVQKPRPEDATILILNGRCQMNHIVYIFPI